MKLLIFYDIVQTKNRNLVVEELETFGFYRIQKSVFLGNINETKYKTFVIELSLHILKEDLLYIIPVTNSSFNKISSLGANIKPILQVLKNNEFDFEDIIV